MDRKTTLKKEVLIKLLNRVLIEMKKDEITDIIAFEKIDREKLLIVDTLKILNDMEEEIFKVFNKYTCRWYRRSAAKQYFLVFIKNACSDIGYKLTSTQRDVSEIVNNKSFRRTHIFYSIKMISTIEHTN